MGSRVVKEARLKILCVMLPGFKSLPMYLIIKLYNKFYYSFFHIKFPATYVPSLITFPIVDLGIPVCLEA